MGNYRQWLYYREVDQQLQGQLHHLEQELVRLQEQLSLLEGASFSTDNEIIRALLLVQATRVPSSAAQPTPGPQKATASTTHVEQPTKTISPALFAWSRLPNFDAQQVRGSIPDRKPSTSPRPSTTPVATESATNAESDYGHDITAPQTKLPWWLLNNGISPDAVQGNGPIDQQSVHINSQVQRWLQRWGRRQNIQGNGDQS